MDRYMRRPEVEGRVGLSRSTLYAMMAEGQFPKPVKLGARAVGWTESSIETWIQSRHSKAPDRLRAEAAAIMAHADALEAEGKAA